MTNSDSQRLEAALGEIETIRRMFEEASIALQRSLEALHSMRDHILESEIEALARPNVVPTDHRRAHRFGRPAKIDTDAEVEAFFLAWIDRMTFEEMAAHLAEHFQPDRCVGRSAIHSWWQRTCEAQG